MDRGHRKRERDEEERASERDEKIERANDKRAGELVYQRKRSTIQASFAGFAYKLFHSTVDTLIAKLTVNKVYLLPGGWGCWRCRRGRGGGGGGGRLRWWCHYSLYSRNGNNRCWRMVRGCFPVDRPESPFIFHSPFSDLDRPNKD